MAEVTITVKGQNEEKNNIIFKYELDANFLTWKYMGILLDPTILINMHCKQQKITISQWVIDLSKTNNSDYEIPKIAYQMFYINDNAMAYLDATKKTVPILIINKEKTADYLLSLNGSTGLWKMDKEVTKTDLGEPYVGKPTQTFNDFPALVRKYNQFLIDPYENIQQGKQNNWVNLKNIDKSFKEIKDVMFGDKSYMLDLCTQIVYWNSLNFGKNENKVYTTYKQLIAQMLKKRIEDDPKDESYVIGACIYQEAQEKGINATWPILISLNCKGRCKSAHAETRGLLFLEYLFLLTTETNQTATIKLNPYCQTSGKNVDSKTLGAITAALASYENHLTSTTTTQQIKLYSTLLPCYMCEGTVIHSRVTKTNKIDTVDYMDHDFNVNYMNVKKGPMPINIIEGVIFTGIIRPITKESENNMYIEPKAGYSREEDKMIYANNLFALSQPPKGIKPIDLQKLINNEPQKNRSRSAPHG